MPKGSQPFEAQAASRTARDFVALSCTRKVVKNASPAGRRTAEICIQFSDFNQRPGIGSARFGGISPIREVLRQPPTRCGMGAENFHQNLGKPALRLAFEFVNMGQGRCGSQFAALIRDPPIAAETWRRAQRGRRGARPARRSASIRAAVFWTVCRRWRDGGWVARKPLDPVSIRVNGAAPAIGS